MSTLACSLAEVDVVAQVYNLEWRIKEDKEVQINLLLLQLLRTVLETRAVLIDLFSDKELLDQLITMHRLLRADQLEWLLSIKAM